MCPPHRVGRHILGVFVDDRPAKGPRKHLDGLQAGSRPHLQVQQKCAGFRVTLNFDGLHAGPRPHLLAAEACDRRRGERVVGTATSGRKASAAHARGRAGPGAAQTRAGRAAQRPHCCLEQAGSAAPPPRCAEREAHAAALQCSFRPWRAAALRRRSALTKKTVRGGQRRARGPGGRRRTSTSVSPSAAAFFLSGSGTTCRHGGKEGVVRVCVCICEWGGWGWVGGGEEAVGGKGGSTLDGHRTGPCRAKAGPQVRRPLPQVRRRSDVQHY